VTTILGDWRLAIGPRQSVASRPAPLTLPGADVAEERKRCGSSRWTIGAGAPGVGSRRDIVTIMTPTQRMSVVSDRDRDPGPGTRIDTGRGWVVLGGLIVVGWLIANLTYLPAFAFCAAHSTHQRWRSSTGRYRSRPGGSGADHRRHHARPHRRCPTANLFDRVGRLA
jgi:hypothetical protein